MELKQFLLARLGEDARAAGGDDPQWQVFEQALTSTQSLTTWSRTCRSCAAGWPTRPSTTTLGRCQAPVRHGDYSGLGPALVDQQEEWVDASDRA